MKKLLFISMLFMGLLSLSSCSFDNNEPDVPQAE